MNKSHATIFLTRLMGEIDGHWSEEEMKAVCLLGDLSSALDEAPDWADKIKSSELNERSAYFILNQESKEVQMQCLVNVLLTAFGDGKVEDTETALLGRILANLNQGITIDELIEAHEAQLNKFR